MNDYSPWIFLQVAIIISGATGVVYGSWQLCKLAYHNLFHRAPEYIPGTLRIVIIDHYSQVIYTNCIGKQAAQFVTHELNLRGGTGTKYMRMPLTAGMRSEIPDTTTLVARFNNTYWIDIVGDIINFTA